MCPPTCGSQPPCLGLQGRDTSTYLLTYAGQHVPAGPPTLDSQAQLAVKRLDTESWPCLDMSAGGSGLRLVVVNASSDKRGLGLATTRRTPCTYYHYSDVAIMENDSEL